VVTQAQQQVPANWEGSMPEYVAYQTFIRLGLEPGLDFVYQSPLMGGRLDKGGLVIDFLFAEPPNLAVNINGVYYHYHHGVEARARDIMARTSLAGEGTTLIFIDDDDLLRDPDYYCQQALQFRDHSQLGGG
jgi:hypothetical protein